MTSGVATVSLPELQPLVAIPDDVRHFSHERRAGIAEVGPAGVMRLDSIARWVQDVAWDDVTDSGLQGLSVWLVRRTRIRVRSFPHLDGRYRLTTCITGVGRMWAERRTDLSELVDGEPAGEPIAETACIWVHIDPERELPSPIHQVELDMWTGPSTRPVKARLRHPAPPAGAATVGWVFRASDLDIVGHVNNTAYFTAIDDELIATGAGVTGGIDVEIEYRTPAPAGPMELLAAGPMRWFQAPGGELHAAAALAGWPAAGGPASGPPATPATAPATAPDPAPPLGS